MEIGMDSGQLRIPLFLLSYFQEASISTGIYMVLGKLRCDFIDVPTRVTCELGYVNHIGFKKIDVLMSME